MGILDKLKSIKDSSSSAQHQFAPPPPRVPLESSLLRFRKQRGINLGSWFVTEDWIATSIYSNAASPKKSDFDIAKSNNARQVLENHWDTWITADDWRWITEKGFNSVRIPIGYYHLSAALPEVLKGTDFEPFKDIFVGAWERIINAINTAGQHGLGVLIDFHAAPGAQNPDAHSGLSNGHVGLWSRRNLEATSLALRFLASTLSQYDNVVGLELLNEPQNNNRLQKWYESTIAECRAAGGSDLPLYVGDAWDSAWYAPWTGKRDDFVVLDHHLYRCFDASDRKLSGVQHATKLRSEFAATFAQWCTQAKGSLVVGEWSAGLDDSALPNGTPDAEKDRHKREFVQAQLDLFNDNAAGYWFWTLKTDRPWNAGWSAHNAAQAEILPASVARRFNLPPQKGAREACQKKAYDTHVEYWSSRGGTPEPSVFASAYTKGWDDALLFLMSPQSTGNNELGFVAQWSLRRREEFEVGRTQLGKGAWEWDHGFQNGVSDCHGVTLVRA